jgi:hypothetical protein
MVAAEPTIPLAGRDVTRTAITWRSNDARPRPAGLQRLKQNSSRLGYAAARQRLSPD